MEGVFTEVAMLLVELGHVKLENCLVDGTNTERCKKDLEAKTAALMEEIDRINNAENEEYGDRRWETPSLCPERVVGLSSRSMVEPESVFDRLKGY
ncbi:MAG: hypothetical protein ACOYEP_10620 [Limnochordia bacterium]|jgi:hypothetical protein